MGQDLSATQNHTILETKGLTKKFGGVVAINNLDLVVKKDELRCIIGPNGAGKSTLFNLITGLFRPNTGSVIFNGQDITGVLPDKLCRMGIGRKFQIPNVFLTLTVKDNLKLALSGNQGIKEMFTGSGKTDEQDIEKTLQSIGLLDKVNYTAETLSHGEKQWLEIGMVLINSPVLMLLDEPTAGMSPDETTKTAELIKKISTNMTVVIIEHDINFIRQIDGCITVLHRGSKLAEGTLAEIAENEEVMDVYFGRNEKLVCQE